MRSTMRPDRGESVPRTGDFRLGCLFSRGWLAAPAATLALVSRMAIVRIGLAALRFPTSIDDAIARVKGAIAEARERGAKVVAFPEAYVPGYRALGADVAPPDQAAFERAWSAIAEAARVAGITVVLGTERFVDSRLRLSALVIDRDGHPLGFQDKVQLDPSEDALYVPGESRATFDIEGLRFGVVICHEGWRYPETVRWAARDGAELVFHLHFHPPEPGAFRPTTFADPRSTFHEKALLCRAAENTCFIASVNCACEGAPTTSAVVRPDGTVLAWQPYGEEGVLIADIDTGEATRLLAQRLRAVRPESTRR